MRSVMNRDHYTLKDKIYYKKGLRLQAIDFSKDFYYGKWSNMSQFEKCCWQWQKKDNFIYDAIKNDSHAITIKFEDIFNKEKGHLGIYQLVDFLNIQLPKGKIENLCENSMGNRVNINKKEDFPRWRKWDNSLRKRFLNIASSQMKRYNYNLKDF